MLRQSYARHMAEYVLLTFSARYLQKVHSRLGKDSFSTDSGLAQDKTRIRIRIRLDRRLKPVHSSPRSFKH